MQTKLLPLHPLLHQEFHSIDLSVSTLADGSHPPLIPPTPLLFSPSKFAFSSKGVNWRRGNAHDEHEDAKIEKAKYIR